VARHHVSQGLSDWAHYGRIGPEHAGDTEVIGVVKDAKFSAAGDPQPVDYFPYSQQLDI